MTPAAVLSFEQARLRRAVASGELSVVLDAVERVLCVRAPVTTPCRQEAVTAFYSVFWACMEDEELADQAGDLDALVGASGSADVTHKCK